MNLKNRIARKLYMKRQLLASASTPVAAREIQGVHSVAYPQYEMPRRRCRLGVGGIMCLSPIQIACQTFNLALTQRETDGKQTEAE